MISGIFSRDIAFVLTLFSLSPGSRILRNDIKDKTKLDNLTLDKAINTLINTGVLKKEGRYLLLNLDNARQIIEIVSHDYKLLKQIPLDAYFSIFSIASFLNRFFGVDVYLFGSYSKLIYKDTSDIDIAIVSDKISAKDKKEISRFAQKAYKRYKKRIELHYFGKDFYKNKSDIFVREILKNGVKLI